MTDADHVRVGFNTGLLDIMSLMFMSLATAANVEPQIFAALLADQLTFIDKQGGDPKYIAARKLVLQTLHDQMACLTLADMRRATPKPKFEIIRGALDEAAPRGGG